MNNYYYGKTDKAESWFETAHHFAQHNSAHSKKTSSLPLVQFWKPKPNRDFELRIRAFASACNQKYEEFSKGKFCFEYPVAPNQPIAKFGKGSASMTDLMIFGAESVFALEAKWTECETSYEPIGKWRKKNPRNRTQVLDGWLTYIREYIESHAGNSTAIPSSESIIQDHPEVPYQLIHRIASACKVAEENSCTPVTVYHLFYEANKREKTNAFATSRLYTSFQNVFADIAHLLPFFVVSTEVSTNKRITDKIKRTNDLFDEMQHNTVYNFGMTGLVPK